MRCQKQSPVQDFVGKFCYFSLFLIRYRLLKTTLYSSITRLLLWEEGGRGRVATVNRFYSCCGNSIVEESYRLLGGEKGDIRKTLFAPLHVTQSKKGKLSILFTAVTRLDWILSILIWPMAKLDQFLQSRPMLSDCDENPNEPQNVRIFYRKTAVRKRRCAGEAGAGGTPRFFSFFWVLLDQGEF